MTRHYSIAVAVAVSAVLALALTVREPVTPVNDSLRGDAPGMQVAAAHTLVADYVQMTGEARLVADRAADAELAASREQAVAEAVLRVVASKPKAAKVVHAANVVPLPEPSPIAAPLPLPAPQPVAALAAPKRPVLSRVVGTVERIPGWVGARVVNAAAWVVDLPGQALARLPERRFL